MPSICTGHSSTRGGATDSEARGVSPARPNLFASYRYPQLSFFSGTGSRPVVIASRSTCETMSADGRLITHSRVRRRFSDVCPIAPSPSMQLQPSHHADDIGARLDVPSGLVLLIKATGVPK